MTVDRDRTDASGPLPPALARPQAPAPRTLRVHFGGDRATCARPRSGARPRRTSTAARSRRGTAPACTATTSPAAGALTPGTLGVAHKSLPCGTKVTLRYRGRTVRVRVIDRGPYVGAREFDLTAATKQRLGFGSTGTVLTTR